MEMYGRIRDRIGNRRAFLVTDCHLAEMTWMIPLIDEMSRAGYGIIVIPAGEVSKNIGTVARIWERLALGGATRSSVLVNVGGGMVTDLGGFAAATFKRGIPCVNVSTTLLGAVDAATGGKTGVNLTVCEGGHGTVLKNEVGAFAMPESVLVWGESFETLPRCELLSGYGEMLKTGLIADAALYGRLLSATGDIECPARLGVMVERCVEIKDEVCRADPREDGLRMVLNFGHTFGHAFESLCLERGEAVPHGVAVAHGLLAELILSHLTLGLPSGVVYGYRDMLRETFGVLPVRCGDMERIMYLTGHDKKNRTAGSPRFTLLRGVGDPVVGCEPDKGDIRAALDIYFTER